MIKISYVAFSTSFKPIVLIGELLAELDNVETLKPKRVWRVTYIEPLAEFRKDFGSLTSGGATAKTEMTELRVNDLRILQVRFLPLDDIKVETFFGQSNQRAAIRNATFVITQGIMGLDPTLSKTEIWNIEDKRLFFTVTNLSAVTKSKNRILFTGFQYFVSEVDVSKMDVGKLKRLPMTFIPVAAGGS